MNPSLSRTSDGKLIYQLNPDLKYRRSNLDSSDYPGEKLYRRMVHDAGAGMRRRRATARPPRRAC